MDNDSARQRISVCRLDGISDLWKDIVGIYKNVVRSKDGAGSGPVKEYFTNVIQLLEEDIPSSSGKPLVFFEGESDHCVPVHDQSVRLQGFKAAGQMLGHALLHGGPGLHGLSPAIKHYSTTAKSNTDEPPPISIRDVQIMNI